MHIVNFVTVAGPEGNVRASSFALNYLGKGAPTLAIKYWAGIYYFPWVA